MTTPYYIAPISINISPNNKKRIFLKATQEGLSKNLQDEIFIPLKKSRNQKNKKGLRVFYSLDCFNHWLKRKLANFAEYFWSIFRYGVGKGDETKDDARWQEGFGKVWKWIMSHIISPLIYWWPSMTTFEKQQFYTELSLIPIHSCFLEKYFVQFCNVLMFFIGNVGIPFFWSKLNINYQRLLENWIDVLDFTKKGGY